MPSVSYSYSGIASPKCAASAPEQLKSAKEDIKELLRTTFCHPIMVILDRNMSGYVIVRNGFAFFCSDDIIYNMSLHLAPKFMIFFVRNE